MNQWRITPDIDQIHLIHMCETVVSIYVSIYSIYSTRIQIDAKTNTNGMETLKKKAQCVVRPRIKGTIAKSKGSSSSPIIFQQLLHQFSGSISNQFTKKKPARMGWNTEIKQFLPFILLSQHVRFTHLTLSCGRCSFTPPHHAGIATFVVKLAAPPRAGNHKETTNGGQTT